MGREREDSEQNMGGWQRETGRGAGRKQTAGRPGEGASRQRKEEKEVRPPRAFDFSGCALPRASPPAAVMDSDMLGAGWRKVRSQWLIPVDPNQQGRYVELIEWQAGAGGGSEGHGWRRGEKGRAGEERE